MAEGDAVMGTTLILIGIGCMIAGIVGGGIKLHQLEVGTVKSVWRQILLFLFGGVLAATGVAKDSDKPQDAEKGNVQGPVGPAPVDNGTTPDVDERESEEPIARTPVDLSGRWNAEGTVIVFRQSGSSLTLIGPGGESGSGTIDGNQARWDLTGEGMGRIECRAEVTPDRQVIAGSCLESGGEILPIRLERL